MNRRDLSLPIVVLGLLTVIGAVVVAAEADRPQAATAVDKQLAGLHVTGPYEYKNLAVYLLHRDRRDDRVFLTLNDGLTRKLVKVTEVEEGEVNTLLIENLSDDPLFLQEGDRVTGGKQDRTIYTSLVIAPKSGPQHIPAFCVEPSRWTESDSGKAFKGNPNIGYAANAVRGASKLLKNQGLVWQNVAQAKAQLMESIGTSDKTSSLNEAQDSAKVTQATQEFLKALRGAADKHNDLVGVAFAVNGRVQEVNVFPGRSLVKQVYPRLLETYALDAIMQPAEKDKPLPEAPTSDAVLALLGAKFKAQTERQEDINADNRLEITAAQKTEQGDKSRFYRCLTQYDGQAVHLQWIQGPPSLAQAMRDQQQQFDAQQLDNTQNDLSPLNDLLQDQTDNVINRRNFVPQQIRQQESTPQQRREAPENAPRP